MMFYLDPSCRKKEAKNKNHIICFTCRERGHYDMKCLRGDEEEANEELKG